MKIYIQSRSGNYNSVWNIGYYSGLKSAMKELRAAGGYSALDTNRCALFVPFEEIEFIREASDAEIVR